MLIFIIILVLFALAVWGFMQSPKFGQTPRGERLQRIQQSPHYQNGSFKNLSPTPDLTEGASFFSVLWKFLFGKKVRRKPSGPVPHIKTDLHQLAPDADVLVWMGHSSYFIQTDGKKFLIDPILNGTASPLPYGIQSFEGSNIYSAADIPAIDYLMITHDHWDHLDYRAMKQLQPKIGHIITGLGTGQHFERWGFDMSRVTELDWYETTSLEGGFQVVATPARHFSGRGLARNKALWTSFVLRTPTQQLFLGGDSGFDSHFEKIGEQFGGFDWAIVENGQYDANWKYIHLMPDEFLPAVKALRAQRIIPVHSGKFAMANHPWDEPLENVTHRNKDMGLSLATPMIGEPIYLKNDRQVFQAWWKTVS